VAQALAAQGYIVPEDVDLAVSLAAQRYDALARQPAGVSR
jgi:hypothetical protein